MKSFHLRFRLLQSRIVAKLGDPGIFVPGIVAVQTSTNTLPHGNVPCLLRRTHRTRMARCVAFDRLSGSGGQRVSHHVLSSTPAAAPDLLRTWF